eukprot:Lithocolla_globosa_v1_NODE_138_length_5823_cov_17.507628.p5 type:complete len:117 gc:universal NODE_138_length_5823_cov_17.507628:1354-1004(-)
MDGGSGFKTKFRLMLKSHGIDYYTADPGEKNKMAMIERWNRTIREKIEKYLTSRNTNRWVDVLQKLVKNYNNTVHGTTGFKPNQVGKKEFDIIQNQKLERIQDVRLTSEIQNWRHC